MNAIKVLTILLLSNLTFAFTELNVDFGYDKNIYGSQRQSSDTDRTYSGSVTFYFLSKTGIEFNYSHSEKEIIGKYDNSGITTGLVIDNEYTNIKTQSFGIGIRQAFGSKKSFIQPFISFGWSRRMYELRSRTLVKDLDTPEDIVIDSGVEEDVYDAMFAAFALKFRLTRGFALKGSVQTAFRAFEFGEARDQLSYNVGLAWMF